MHSPIGFSVLEQVEVCPGSVRLQAGKPDDESEAAREGTTCHEAMAWLAAGKACPVDTVMPSTGLAVTRQMLEAIDILFADIQSVLGMGWRQIVVVERPVWAPRIHPQCFGTPDIRAWTQMGDRRWLYVWELKYGHKVKEAFHNRQLIAQACACLSEANATAQATGQAAWPESQVTCMLTIVQPRAYHAGGPVRRWVVHAPDLLPHVQRLASAAMVALEPDAPCNPQPSACEDCRARYDCTALQQAAYRVMDISTQVIPIEMTDQAMGLELAMAQDYAKLLDARIEGLQEQVAHRLRSGAIVPRWEMGRGRGATVWDKPTPEVQALGQMFGLDLMRPPEPITPLQAVTAGLPDAMLASYARTVPGKTALKRVNDKAAEQVFTAPPL